MQWPSEIGPKSLKAQNVAAAKLLISWGSMACTKNAGCFPRHLAINSILKRSLTRTGLPSTLEPVDLTNNGRRPDGLTLGPWYRGRSLVWDTTVVDTFAQGHYKDSARQAGFAATKAEVAKCQKYHDLQSNYHFQPVAIETTGVYGKSTAPFLSGLLKKLVDVSDDPSVEFVLAPQHRTSCDPETITKEDFDYGEESNLEVF